MLMKNDITIYSAGKTWAAHAFKKMRDDYHYNINARWIDLPQVLANANDTFSPEDLADSELTAGIWDDGCKVDACNADMGILFCSEADKNLHSGSLVELGHLTASSHYTGIRKPVYIVGSRESVRPVGNSDRAWKFQKDVHHFENIADIHIGFSMAIQHYAHNYEQDWKVNQRMRERIANYG